MKTVRLDAHKCINVVLTSGSRWFKSNKGSQRKSTPKGVLFSLASIIYDSNGNLIKQSNGLEFFYDYTGVFAVKHNNATYFYRKDAQANIVALLDKTGAVW